MSGDQSASATPVTPPGVPPPGRRTVLQGTGMLMGGSGVGLASASAWAATPPQQPAANSPSRTAGPLRKGMLGFMLGHEQFAVRTLVHNGALASRAGFDLLATSDHLQPWQANEGHAGAAWVTLGALGAQTQGSWMGTTVTCPTLRYNPAVVAEAFASLSLLYPGRIFLGVGSGEALNERAATGAWPKWQERWDRLIEAVTLIRQLWTGQQVSHKGQYYTIDAKLYDPPAQPIPLLTGANGRKSMRLAGQHGDGLVTDPLTWKQHKAEWESGARDAGKDPTAMPVLVEQYVVVGNEADARQAAELWHFGPKAFKGYYDITDPAEIQRRAEAEIPLEQIIAQWPVGTDPGKHIATVQELFDSGVSIVNVHAGQMDQRKVIDFYARHVLPKVGHAA
jgi:TAT-translocated FGD2 family F420-dependent dehydrogenase